MDKFTEELVAKVATEQQMDPEVVSKIVGFQFKDMLRATADSRKIEMTWFGKFYVSRHKCQKRLFKLRDFEAAIEKRLNSGVEMSELRISSYSTKLRRIRAVIDFLRSKIDYEVRLEGTTGGNYEFDPCQEGSEVSLPAKVKYLQRMQSQLGSSEEVPEL
jgi:nucleoid DNA-binding protein